MEPICSSASEPPRLKRCNSLSKVMVRRRCRDGGTSSPTLDSLLTLRRLPSTSPMSSFIRSLLSKADTKAPSSPASKLSKTLLSPVLWRANRERCLSRSCFVTGIVCRRSWAIFPCTNAICSSSSSSKLLKLLPTAKPCRMNFGFCGTAGIFSSWTSSSIDNVLNNLWPRFMLNSRACLRTVFSPIMNQMCDKACHWNDPWPAARSFHSRWTLRVAEAGSKQHEM